METLANSLRISHDWALERIDILNNKYNYEDSLAIKQEFSEWFNPEIEEHDVFSVIYMGEEDADRSS
jgi:hypothetical protein